MELIACSHPERQKNEEDYNYADSQLGSPRSLPLSVSAQRDDNRGDEVSG
jgi:hypothetical protein